VKGASSQVKAENLVRDWVDRNKPSPWLAALWCATLVSVVGMFIFLPENSFDLRVTSEAMHYLRMGVDPYAVSLERQKAEAALGHSKGEAALGHHVFVYLYPPISIEILKVLNRVPAWLRAAIFWIAYAAGFGLQLWGASRFALPAERHMLRFVFPLVIFFPAFVPSDTLLSGNIAIPMYGAVLAAAARGWHKQRWGAFHGVVLACSFFKPPILIWLVIPLLLGSEQVVPAVAAALGGVGLFAVQKFLWAQRFTEFMSSIRYTLPLEINYSLVAMFGKFLEFIGHPSERAAVGFYIAVSLAVFGVLVYFGRAFRRNNVAWQNFAAVLFVSTALFALRLKEYDLLPLTIPMALIVLRGLRNPGARIVLILGVAAVGVALVMDRITAVDTISVTTAFLAGVYELSTEAQSSRTSRASEQSAIPQAVRV
jgi:hypothetical protein